MKNFIKKQITDIKSGGILSLNNKIFILIVYFLKSPIYLISLIILFIIRCFKSIILIRINKIPTFNFGDLICFNALYISKKKLEIDQPNKVFFDLLYIDSKIKVSNLRMLEIWKKKIRIFPSFILKPIDELNKIIPGGSLHSIEILDVKRENDINNLFEKFQAIEFSESEKLEGEDFLQKIGIKNNKFVCFMIRDDSYNELKKFSKDQTYDYHSYRNFELDDFCLAAEELTKRGYYVVRYGYKASKKFKTSNPKIIDYPFSKYKSEFADIYLGARCSFCISTGYGPDMLPYVFNKPIGLIALPLGDLRCHSERIYLLTKSHLLKKENRKLSLKEIFKYDLAYAYETQKYEEKGVILENFSKNEIKDFVLDFCDLVESKKNWSEEDINLQKKFQKVFELEINNSNYHQKVKKPYFKLHGKVRSYFSSNFLKKNPYWLN